MIETKNLIDKILLIGITILNSSDELIAQIQVFGPIIEVNSNGIIILRNQTQSKFSIPADFENISLANPGEYKLRSTGEIVIDPDFISSWTVHSASEKEVEQYSSIGFVGYQKA